jgi:hypothetical protein
MDAVLDQLIGYWENMRAGREAPMRSEIDPRQIDYAIENLFFLETRSMGDMRFRLGGRRVNDLLGTEARGLSALSLFAPESRPRIAAILGEVLSLPATGELRLSAAGPGGTTESAAIVLLPLYGEDARLSRILGCVAGGVRPLVAGSVQLVLEHARITPVRSEGARSPQSDLPGLAEAAMPFRGKPRPALISVSEFPRRDGAGGKKPKLSLVEIHVPGRRT